MNINLTLIVQMLVFIVLIWFTMKFVWPMILGPMDARSQKIAAGLAAAEKGKADLASANERAEAVFREQFDADLPAPVLEVSSTTAIKAAVMGGIGPAVLSVRAVTAELAAGTLVRLAVPGLDLTRRLHAIWPVDVPKPRADQATLR